MQVVGHEYCRLDRGVGEIKLPVHRKALGERLKLTGDGIPRNGKPVQLPLDTHEKSLAFHIRVLIGMDDIPSPAENEIRHCGRDPFLVRARDQQNGMVLRHSVKLSLGTGQYLR